MQGITCRRLLNLTELKFGISDDQFANFETLVRGGPKLRCRNAEAGAGHLNQGGDKRTARPQPNRQANRSFWTDRSDFNSGILWHLHNERDHSALRKINRVQRAAGLLKEFSLPDRNFVQLPEASSRLT
jgi:hypothetical protein